MLKLERIFKNYDETGSFNEQVNLYGFVDSHVFLTKTGDLGAVLEVRGVDYECLDEKSLDGLTKRLESALRLFDHSYRIYQYLFKRNNETIPYKLYGKPVVDTAIKNRLDYFAGKADTIFSLSIYYVLLFEGFRYTRSLGNTLLEFPKKPGKALDVLFHQYGAVILAYIAILFVNLFAAAFALNRKFFLKDTGRKLSHLDKQLHVGQTEVRAPSIEEEVE